MPGGRPTKYTPKIIEEIAAFLAQGNNRVDSCAMAGIAFATFCEWMKRPEFSEAVGRAEAACKQRNIIRIQNASRKDWRAAAWWMERKHPEEYGWQGKGEVELGARTMAEILGEAFRRRGGGKPGGDGKG